MNRHNLEPELRRENGEDNATPTSAQCGDCVDAGSGSSLGGLGLCQEFCEFHIQRFGYLICVA